MVLNLDRLMLAASGNQTQENVLKSEMIPESYMLIGTDFLNIGSTNPS